MDISQGIATVTLNRPRSLNAITAQGSLISGQSTQTDRIDVDSDYDAFAKALREIDKRDDVLVTVWQGMSRNTFLTLGLILFSKPRESGFAREFRILLCSYS